MSKSNYILLDENNCFEVLKYRRTLLELMQDSGFSRNIQIHSDFLPLTNEAQKFREQFRACKERHLPSMNEHIGGAAAGEKGNTAPSAATNSLSTAPTCTEQKYPDPLSYVKGPLHQFDPNSIHLTKVVQKLSTQLEWSLFLYGKQDLNLISNRSDQFCPLLEKSYTKWIYEAMEVDNTMEVKTNNNKEPVLRPNPPPVDIFIVFSRLTKINKGVYLNFVKYLQLYHVSHGILVSMDGASTEIKKKINDTTALPHIRVLAYQAATSNESGLLNNLMRESDLTPLYRRLNTWEIQVLTHKFGSPFCFPKLYQSGPVCQYYGFRQGDLVLANVCVKRVKHHVPRSSFNCSVHENTYLDNSDQTHDKQWFCSILDQLEDPHSWIHELRFYIVIHK